MERAPSTADFTIRQVMSICNLTDPRQVYRLIERGQLRAYRAGQKDWRVTPAALAEFRGEVVT